MVLEVEAVRYQLGGFIRLMFRKVNGLSKFDDVLTIDGFNYIDATVFIFICCEVRH